MEITVNDRRTIANSRVPVKIDVTSIDKNGFQTKQIKEFNQSVTMYKGKGDSLMMFSNRVSLDKVGEDLVLNIPLDNFGLETIPVELRRHMPDMDRVSFNLSQARNSKISVSKADNGITFKFQGNDGNEFICDVTPTGLSLKCAGLELHSKPELQDLTQGDIVQCTLTQECFEKFLQHDDGKPEFSFASVKSMPVEFIDAYMHLQDGQIGPSNEDARYQICKISGQNENENYYFLRSKSGVYVVNNGSPMKIKNMAFKADNDQLYLRVENSKARIHDAISNFTYIPLNNLDTSVVRNTVDFIAARINQKDNNAKFTEDNRVVATAVTNDEKKKIRLTTPEYSHVIKERTTVREQERESFVSPDIDSGYPGGGSGGYPGDTSGYTTPSGGDDTSAPAGGDDSTTPSGNDSTAPFEEAVYDTEIPDNTEGIAVTDDTPFEEFKPVEETERVEEAERVEKAAHIEETPAGDGNYASDDTTPPPAGDTTPPRSSKREEPAKEEVAPPPPSQEQTPPEGNGDTPKEDKEPDKEEKKGINTKALQTLGGLLLLMSPAFLVLGPLVPLILVPALGALTCFGIAAYADKISNPFAKVRREHIVPMQKLEQEQQKQHEKFISQEQEAENAQNDSDSKENIVEQNRGPLIELMRSMYGDELAVFLGQDNLEMRNNFIEDFIELRQNYENAKDYTTRNNLRDEFLKKYRYPTPNETYLDVQRDADGNIIRSVKNRHDLDAPFSVSEALKDAFDRAMTEDIKEDLTNLRELRDAQSYALKVHQEVAEKIINSNSRMFAKMVNFKDQDKREKFAREYATAIAQRLTLSRPVGNQRDLRYLQSLSEETREIIRKEYETKIKSAYSQIEDNVALRKYEQRVQKGIEFLGNAKLKALSMPDTTPIVTDRTLEEGARDYVYSIMAEDADLASTTYQYDLEHIDMDSLPRGPVGTEEDARLTEVKKYIQDSKTPPSIDAMFDGETKAGTVITQKIRERDALLRKVGFYKDAAHKQFVADTFEYAEVGQYSIDKAIEQYTQEVIAAGGNNVENAEKIDALTKQINAIARTANTIAGSKTPIQKAINEVSSLTDEDRAALKKAEKEINDRDFANIMARTTREAYDKEVLTRDDSRAALNDQIETVKSLGLNDDPKCVDKLLEKLDENSAKNWHDVADTIALLPTDTITVEDGPLGSKACKASEILKRVEKPIDLKRELNNLNIARDKQKQAVIEKTAKVLGKKYAKRQMSVEFRKQNKGLTISEALETKPLTGKRSRRDQKAEVAAKNIDRQHLSNMRFLDKLEKVKKHALLHNDTQLADAWAALLTPDKKNPTSLENIKIGKFKAVIGGKKVTINQKTLKNIDPRTLSQDDVNSIIQAVGVTMEKKTTKLSKNLGKFFSRHPHKTISPEKVSNDTLKRNASVMSHVVEEMDNHSVTKQRGLGAEAEIVTEPSDQLRYEEEMRRAQEQLNASKERNEEIQNS